MENGEKIEPLSPVEVKIEYDDAPVITDDAELSIVHFAEEGTEVIDDIEINDDATEIVYEQESFSVTATIVTGTPELPEYKNGKTYVLVAKYNDKYSLIYIGGGTPSVLDEAMIGKILGKIRSDYVDSPVQKLQKPFISNSDSKTAGIRSCKLAYKKLFIFPVFQDIASKSVYSRTVNIPLKDSLKTGINIRVKDDFCIRKLSFDIVILHCIILI